ncbi:MAG: exo-alpha-sialidase, partial [Thermoanaerobaculia bacterium]|nr:exo-alpha-sialidase [Thermoanaerobaculia bacterium]
MSSGHSLALIGRDGIYGSADGRNWTKATSGLSGTATYTGISVSGSNVFVSSNQGVYKMGANETQWSSVGPTVFGIAVSTTSIAIHGSNVYAGAATGVFKSTDGGATWNPLSGVLASVGTLAVTSNYVWAATNAGVYRSSNGGTSWEAYNSGLVNVNVPRVHASGSSVFATAANSPSGVYRSTDGCASWTPTSLTMATGFRAIATSGSTVLVSAPGGANAMYRSADAGVTWSLLSGPSGAALLSMTTSGSAFLGVAPFPTRLYRSTDDGSTWGPYGSGFPSSATSAAVVASNGNTIVAAADAAVAWSLDAGATWSVGSSVPGATGFAFLAFTGNTLWAGSGDALHRTSDLGVTWTRIDGAPVNVTSIAASGSRLILGTSSDGLFTSSDNGVTWIRFRTDLAGIGVNSLAVSGATACVGTAGRSVLALPFAPTVRRLVPVVLDVVGNAHYTSELTLTNRGTSDSQVTYLYTASLGTGTGSASEVLDHGSNLVIPDVIAYLRGKGLSIPNDGSAQAGTLLVTFDNLSDSDVASAVARTTAATNAPQPVGSAGLAYSAVDPDRGASGALTVYGLRSTATDRSNLAVYNCGPVAVTFSVTVYSGDGSGASAVVATADTLPGWGWTQYNRVLDGAGFTNGWATVRRTSATGSFGTYGVINDNATNDGSFVLPGPSDLRPLYLNVPVLVETSSFVSELVLTNAATKPADFVLSYDESLSAAGPGNRSILIRFPASTQQIVP